MQREPFAPPPSGTSSDAIRESFLARLLYSLGKRPANSTVLDRFLALAYTVRDRMVERWIETQQRYYMRDAKRVYYLSAEFLMGRALYNNMLNLGLLDPCQEALRQLGMELPELIEQERDAGLGNGGLGRLAPGFLASLPTLGLPGYGYGIRYEYGMFAQRFVGGRQVEYPDHWLVQGNPWEFARPEVKYKIQFGGRVVVDESGGAK